MLSLFSYTDKIQLHSKICSLLFLVEIFKYVSISHLKNSETIIGERRENKWEISERETAHERLLTLGNERGVVEREVGGGLG